MNNILLENQLSLKKKKSAVEKPTLLRRVQDSSEHKLMVMTVDEFPLQVHQTFYRSKVNRFQDHLQFQKEEKKNYLRKLRDFILGQIKHQNGKIQAYIKVEKNQGLLEFSIKIKVGSFI